MFNGMIRLVLIVIFCREWFEHAAIDFRFEYINEWSLPITNVEILYGRRCDESI